MAAMMHIAQTHRDNEEDLMAKLIMMRHGQSIWNQRNLFTGWVDIPLSQKGIQEALEGGNLIKDLPIDYIFTSSLIRAQMTAMLVMSVHTSGKVPVVLHRGEGNLDKWSEIHGEAAKSEVIPVICSWTLNERMYGELQGLNKAETAEKFGAQQIQIWRRSYSIAPPNGESLKMTAERTLPFFRTEIYPLLEQGKNVFIAAHGNSLRSIVMLIENLSEDEVVSLEIATGVPVFYEFRDKKFTKA
jgi:2,3-bisphosphoglycerate-dependent phosphoglycerate mutase